MADPLRGRLALESGAVFEGALFGGAASATGEVVFNTCMSGYQEVITDPSYAGQVVVMTHPLIGNYGCRDDTAESFRVHCRGLVVRELSEDAGHAGAERTLDDELRRWGVPGLRGIDTRALTRHLRDAGTLRGVIGSALAMSADEQVALARTAPSLSDEDLVAEVAHQGRSFRWDHALDATLERGVTLTGGCGAFPGMRVVVLDLGVKYNQLRALRSRGAEVTVLRHDCSLDEVLALRPDGVLISNGPGDPARLDAPVALTNELLARRIPLLGICLGHQVLGRAIGATTSRLRFGHHGGNHPVRDEQHGTVRITSHNHEFQVDEASISAASGWYVSERNLHDGSVEGLRHRSLPAFSVQYHPEGAPGPQDRAEVFDEFLRMCMEARSSVLRAGGTPSEAFLRQASAPEASAEDAPGEAVLSLPGRPEPRAGGGETSPEDRAGAAVAAPPLIYEDAASARPRCVLVIGAGPVVIGQAAEFDYAGTQACRALREEGVRVVLVNSNPATIMTDDGIADAVYVEPLTVAVVERIIAAEKPDGLLATLGGQTGLNLAVALDDAGIIERYGLRVLGTSLRSIRTAEDRGLFKALLDEIGEPVPDSRTVASLAEARAFAADVGLPLVVRPAYTLGGTGGGFCETDGQLAERVAAGLAASPISQVLIERSLAGWRELEYEVMRDAAGTCITVCNMENIDPMGVHTGDSIVVAPAQTLTDREHQQLRSAALRIISALRIAGGCNVQFAMHPQTHEYYVIEVNPRVSRSSALASKATGYPIARVAAKIAVGRRLEQITNAVTGKTCAAFEPALDYCVVKIPRWPFDKFPDADRRLGTQMKSTGEVMAIERSFEAAFNKALRSLEQRRPDPMTLRDPVLLESANDRRIFAVMEALRGGIPVEEVVRRSTIAPWFVERLRKIVECEERLRWSDGPTDVVREAKRLGIGDARIADLRGTDVSDVRAMRHGAGISPVYKSVDTCAAEFEATTPYYYSTYEVEDETHPRDAEVGTVIVIGSGPIRIGQGIEFDYCSVQAASALRDAGLEAVMINSNPETVSTDFDCSDRLYFEPLDAESALAVIDAEKPRGVVVQFGGQTAVNLAGPLHNAGVRLLGSDVDTIDAAEDRHRFEALLRSLDIAQPRGAATHDLADAISIAERIGYPVLVRPSYVLGGRAMEVVHSRDALEQYLVAALAVLPDEGSQRRGAVLVDKYLFGTEVDVDAISDGDTVVIPGLMEHIERAGVHSGDSMAAYPAPRLEPEVRDQIVADTVRVATALRIRGLCNIQFVVYRGIAHVLEVNPRASRTVPFLSKVSGVPMVELAVRVMAGQSLASLGWSSGLVEPRPLVAVKAPVFSTVKLTDVDTVLGPEMKSTGEVMGIDVTLGAALEKAFLAALGAVPSGGGALCSVADADKAEALPILAQLSAIGFTLYATAGTVAVLAGAGISATAVGRLGHGRPNVIDVIEDGRVQLVINTVSHVLTDELDYDRDGGALVAAGRTVKDGYRIRLAAEQRRIPCCTSLDTAAALVDAIGRQLSGERFAVAPVRAYREGAVGVMS